MAVLLSHDAGRAARFFLAPPYVLPAGGAALGGLVLGCGPAPLQRWEGPGLLSPWVLPVMGPAGAGRAGHRQGSRRAEG